MSVYIVVCVSASLPPIPDEALATFCIDRAETYLRVRPKLTQQPRTYCVGRHGHTMLATDTARCLCDL